MEIERKYLVPEPPDLSGATFDEVEQGYLSLGAEGEVRLRKRGERLLLTVKRGEGMIREEREVELDSVQFKQLWPATEGRRLRKRRHVLPHEGFEIEVDVYEGELAGLAVAEIEFPDEETARAFEAPSWLGSEVTGDAAYLNESLAVNGRPA
jgi:CYTH domain-containing protein